MEFQNRARCRQCGDVIESVHRHNRVKCRCGAIELDGGTEVPRLIGAQLEDFLEHPLAVKYLKQLQKQQTESNNEGMTMNEYKSLLEKLNRLTDAWKAQFQTPYEAPDLPLIWKIEDGILLLDDIWNCPVKYIRQDKLDEAPGWVNPVSMEIDLIGGSVNIIITKWMGKYSIAGVERTVV